MWERKRRVNFNSAHHLSLLFNCLILHECFPWACQKDNRCIYNRWVTLGQSHSLNESMWLPVIWRCKYLLKAFLCYFSSPDRVSWQGIHSTPGFSLGQLVVCTNVLDLTVTDAVSVWGLLHRDKSWTISWQTYCHNLVDYEILEDYSSWVCKVLFPLRGRGELFVPQTWANRPDLCPGNDLGSVLDSQEESFTLFL